MDFHIWSSLFYKVLDPLTLKIGNYYKVHKGLHTNTALTKLAVL